MSGIGTPEWMGRLRSLRCRFVLVGLRDAEMDEMLRMDHQLRGFEAAADRPMPPGWKRADQHTPRAGQRVLVKLPQCRELVMEWDAARRVACDPDNRTRVVGPTGLMWLDYPTPPEL